MTEIADAAHMRRALRLASRGRGHVSPNPMVGAVVVAADGRILGEGYHQQLGGPHAEAHALRAAGDQARGSTVYCTLEPCAHHGRTPPCSEALIQAGVRRVVVALQDPDQHVGGTGFRLLREAGIQVDVGVGAQAVEEQLAAYLHHRRHGRPRVWLKLGQSLDGRIATKTGASRWITGEVARRHAHQWRSWMDMIAVGAGTISADDPALTVRHVEGRDPRALVISANLSCPPTAQIFGREGTVLATSDHDVAAAADYAARGAQIWSMGATDSLLDLPALMQRAGNEGITSLLIEGGRTLAAAALRAQIVDEVMVYVAPRLIGEGLAGVGDLGVEEIDDSLSLEAVTTRRLGDDVLYTGKVVYPCSPD